MELDGDEGLVMGIEEIRYREDRGKEYWETTEKGRGLWNELDTQGKRKSQEQMRVTLAKTLTDWAYNHLL